MIQFKLEAKDAMGIVDSWNQIQNNFATSATDLATGLAKVGAVAKQSGTPIQEVEGYITALVASMRIDGSEAGTALKSIMSRVYRVGIEGAEDAGKAEKTLASIGVQVRKSATEFNSFDEILKQLSTKFDTLSGAEKLNIEQVLGGTMHYTKVSALLQNMAMATDATTTAYNSQNSAIEENAKYLQSIQGKYETLKSTVEGKWDSAISSDFIKGTVSGLTKLIDVFGNLPTIIGLTTYALVVFNSKAIFGGISGIASYISALVSLTATEGVTTATTMTLGNALNVLKGIFIGNPLGLLILSLTTVVSLFALTGDGIKVFGESIDDISEKIQELNTKTSEIKSTDNLISKYDELKAKIDVDTKAGIDNKEVKTQLLDIEKQFAQMFKDKVDGYTAEGDAIIKNTDVVKKLNDEKRKQLLIDSTIEYNKIKSKYEPNEKNPFNGQSMNVEVDNYLLAKKTRDKAMAEGNYDIADKNNEVMKNYIANFDKFNQASITLSNLGVKDVEVIDLETGAFKKYSEEIDKNTDATNKNLSAKEKVSIEALTKTFDDSMDKISGYNKLKDEYNKNGSFSSESVKEIIDKHQELAGYLNNEPLLYQKIQEALNTEKDTANKVYREMMINSDSYYESNIKNTDIIKKALGGYYEKLSEDQKKDLENTKNLASAKLIVEGNLVSRLITLRETLSKLSDNYSAFGNPGKELEDTAKIAKTKKEIAEAQASVDAINTSFDSITADIKTTSVDSYGTSTTKALNASKKATEAYDNALTSLNNTMEEYENKLKNVSKGSQEYRNILLEKQKIIKAEIELTKQQIAIQDKLANTYSSTSSSSSGSVTTTTSSSSGTYTGKYADWINASAKKYGLDPRLIAGLIQTESGFNPNAVNKSSGATGLGQFLTDPQSSIEHLVAYLKKRIGWAGGDVNKGIMGYGEGTTAYLNKVLANAKSFGYGSSNTQSTLSSANSDNTTANDAQAKSLQLQKQLLDKNQQLLDLPYLIFESYLTEFDDRSNEASKRISVLRNELEMTSNDGAKEASLMNEIITNLEKELTIAKEKEAFINQEIASRKYTNGQLDEMNKKLLDVKETQSSIALDVRKAYEAELDIVKDVQEKIMDVIRKRYDEEKDLIQKQQDEYNKSNETDDYNKNLSEEQKKLADIQAKIDIVKRDPNAKAKLQDLLKEAEEQQKAIDDMVLEHQKGLNNDMFDAQKQAIDDKSTDEKLVQLASDAISKGFINLGGKIIDIKSEYISFENRFGEGLKATGQLIKSEFIEKLEQAQALIKQLQDINIHINATGADGSSVPSYAVGTTNVPSDTLAMIHAGESIIPSSVNPFNGSNFINMIRQQVSYAIGQVRVPNISASSTNGMNFNMNQPFLVIQGNVAKDSIGDLEKMVDKKMKDFKTLMKDALQSQGIY